MDEFFEFKRWYDFDPTVSLAVELFENAPEKTQIFCADYIIKKANNYGVILNKKRGDFSPLFIISIFPFCAFNNTLFVFFSKYVLLTFLFAYFLCAPLLSAGYIQRSDHSDRFFVNFFG